MDIEKIRKDFPMLSKQMEGHPLIYFDNGATTFKPQSVIESIIKYNTEYSVNVHRGDYELASMLDKEFEQTRETVAQFINAKANEIVFTSGTSESLNLVAYGFARHHLSAGDEILITEAEHASNVLPWYKVCEEKQTVVHFIELDSEGRLTLENVKKAITDKTKLISIAHITNVLGFIAPIKEIVAYAHSKGIYVVVDAAQSIPHITTDVQDLDCDFLAFSGHKIYGPTGIGVLYGKYELLDKTEPFMVGGGMNARFDTCGNILLKHPPYRFEAGTQNIEGVLGLKAAIEYVQSIGLEQIALYEHELKRYAVEKMQELPNVTLYNATSEAAILTFNIKGIFAQDAATYLNTKGIAVRSGQHCAKILMDYLDTSATLRASFSFYNTKEEIDYFVKACKDSSMEGVLSWLI